MHFNDSENATSVFDFFIKAVTCNEKRFQRDKKELLTQFRDEPEMMKIACGRVSRLLCSYFTTTRGYSGDILNAIFSTPRGTRTEFPAEKIEEHSLRWSTWAI